MHERRLPLQHSRSFGGLALRNHAGHARLHDSSLFASNLRQSVPQDFHVVVAERSDAAHDRRGHNVCGVQPPAQANLQDGHVHARVVEDAQREEREEVEERRQTELSRRRRLAKEASASKHALLRL
jgi:hypothetical protein